MQEDDVEQLERPMEGDVQFSGDDLCCCIKTALLIMFGSCFNQLL